MKKQLFPKEFLGTSIEYYTFKIKSSTGIIYLIILGSLITFICLLPLIRINISKTAVGQISPIESRYQILLPVSGRVSFSCFKENLLVQAGDTLLIMDTYVLESELSHKLEEREEAKEFLTDLKTLIKGSGKTLKSERYRREGNEYEFYTEKASNNP